MVIGLCGFKQSGKSSVSGFLQRKYGFVEMSFADGVRAMALGIDPYVKTNSRKTPFMRYSEVLAAKGYEGAKTLDDVRRLLQRVGTEGGRAIFGPDVWVNALLEQYRKSGEVRVVVPDVRFPNEADAIIHALGGTLLRVVREGFEQSEDVHESERHIPDLPAQGTLVASNLTELEEAVDQYMGSIDPRELT